MDFGGGRGPLAGPPPAKSYVAKSDKVREASDQSNGQRGDLVLPSGGGMPAKRPIAGCWMFACSSATNKHHKKAQGSWGSSPKREAPLAGFRGETKQKS